MRYPARTRNHAGFGRRRGDRHRRRGRFGASRRSQFRPQSLPPRRQLGAATARRPSNGCADRHIHRQGRQEHLGVRALRRRHLRGLQPRSDLEIRRLRQGPGEFWRRHGQLAARIFRGPGRQCLGDGRTRRQRQGPHRDQVRARRQGADDARQARRRQQDGRYVQHPLRRLHRPQRRHLRGRRSRRDQQGGHQRPHHEVQQGREVPQDLEPARRGRRRAQHAAQDGDRFPEPAVRGRPRQQPHPALRPGRAAAHRVEAIRPAEQRVDRQERRDLRGGIRNPTRRPIRASSRASGSAAPRTARSRPSFRRTRSS